MNIDLDTESAGGQANPGTATAGHPTLRRRWSTGLLIAGSALLGATAIALWNRRSIARMRAQLQSHSPDPAGSSEEII